jgi:hypothetical protein
VFDHGVMLRFSVDAIGRFAAAHPDEHFYGFAIDAAMLCLASEETFVVTLAKYQAKFAKYFEPANIEALRTNTGDWAYQGFADLNDSNGFDQAAYAEHYDLDADEQRVSAYGQAMDKLLRELTAIKAFDCLTQTPEFSISRVEHEY